MPKLLKVYLVVMLGFIGFFWLDMFGNPNGQVENLPTCSGVRSEAFDQAAEAWKQDDANLCLELEEVTTCRSQDGKGGENKPWLKDTTYPQQTCAVELAEFERIDGEDEDDLEVCHLWREVGVDEDDTENCFLAYAEQSGDVAMCDYLAEEKNQLQCRAFLESDPQYCFEIDYELDWTDDESKRLHAVQWLKDMCVVRLVYRTQEILQCQIIENDERYNKCIVAAIVDESEEVQLQYCELMRATDETTIQMQEECFEGDDVLKGEWGGYDI
jgi:hypothetical protein